MSYHVIIKCNYRPLICYNAESLQFEQKHLADQVSVTVAGKLLIRPVYSL